MENILPEIIERSVRSISNGNGVRRRLPFGGILHIDRPLPFLCVLQVPDNENELNGIDKLIKTEASYLIISEKHKEGLSELIKKIVKILSDQFSAFLLIEFWAGDGAGDKSRSKKNPSFIIYGPDKNPPAIIETLKNGIENIAIKPNPGNVEVRSLKEKSNYSPLLSEEDQKTLSCLILGLEIKPFYKNKNTNEIYPLLFRSLRMELSKVLKKTFFDFVRIQTNHKPANFQALGRRSIVNAVKQIDRELVDINNQYRFLLLVTPVNADKAWNEFKKNNFEKQPVFHYRLMPIDPELMKRKLYNIQIEKVEDPTLAYLFRDKRFEIDKELTMLAQRETPDFLYSSIQLFGGVSEELLKISEDILRNIPFSYNEEKEDYENKNHKNEFIGAEEFAEKALEEIRFLKDQYKGVKEEIEIRKDIIGLVVSDGKLFISNKLKIAKERIKALIQHEVGTHLLTYYNGKAQPLKLFYCGAAGYEQLQEGLAVLAEYLSGGLNLSRLRILAARVKAVDYLIKGISFIDTFNSLTNKYNFEHSQAFTITMRVYRGGGFTKDAVYLKGIINLLKHLKEGNKLEPLLIGKIRQDYIPIIEELIYRKVLRSPLIIPRYLKEPDCLKRLEKVKNGINIINLINPAFPEEIAMGRSRKIIS